MIIRSLIERLRVELKDVERAISEFEDLASQKIAEEAERRATEVEEGRRVLGKVA